MAGARTSKLFLFFVFMALLGLCAAPSGLLGSAQVGKMITVGPSGCDSTTIQAAINAPWNGSIIKGTDHRRRAEAQAAWDQMLDEGLADPSKAPQS